MRKTIVILLCCTVLLLLGYSGYRAYELWKKNHWMTLAKEFLAKGDWQNESLCLQQALRLNPRDVEACRMMANWADITSSRDALTWRRKVVELDPNSVEDQLHLAQTAVFVRDYVTAANALAAVATMGKKAAPYYNVSGQLALGTGKSAEAESDFAEAIRLEPSNPAPQLSLAVVQLHGTNTLDMAEARITLQRISMNSTNVAIRTQAERELVTDALRYRDYNSAQRYSKELLQSPIANYFDKLMRLDVLKANNSGEYSSDLAACKREAATNPPDLYNLTLWFLKYNMPAQALSWMQTLPTNLQTNMPVAVLSAQCQMLLKNWGGLQNALSRENWGNLEYLRQAYISRALREQGLGEASKAQWDVALKSAARQDNNLKSLFRLTVEWNWRDEAQQILWDIVNNYPQEQWAPPQLGTLLYQSGSTRPLMQLCSIELNRNPSNMTTRNNLALTALLLNAQEMNPYDLAHEDYQTAPTNSFIACTYAFSLHLQKKDAEAIKIMQQIPPQYLKNYSTAGYYGLILKATGDNARAVNYLKYALQGKELLPEERTLFERAMVSP